MCVLLQQQDGGSKLVVPGRFVHQGQSVDRAIEVLLEEKVGIALPAGKTPRLLEVFSEPDRDDRSWVISVAKVVVLHQDLVASARGELVPVRSDGSVSVELAYDHAEIVSAAVEAVRDQYEIRKKYLDVSPDPEGLLTPPWTMGQLRKLHEAVLGAPLQKDAFARRMDGLVEPVLQKDGTPVMNVGIGRPAQLQRPKKRR
ncbi:hypothetical protein [Marmoricola sp. OAE513]|uniref:NrtR DNA-binding winged helix domain-containing protein n=1 Tax=Marmoricola sp. OAE513 TaxID=2817894 RepID=UPI001AE4D48D